MIFMKKFLREQNMGIKTLFCFVILFANTFFQADKGLTDQYVSFNNDRYWVMLLYVADYKCINY